MARLSVLVLFLAVVMPCSSFMPLFMPPLQPHAKHTVSPISAPMSLSRLPRGLVRDCGKRARSLVPALRMCTEANSKQQEFDKSIEEGRIKDCVNLLRANEDSLTVTFDTACKMLSQIPLDVSEENERQQQVLTSYIYAYLKKKGIIKGFGYIPATPGYLPVTNKDMDVAEMEKATGYELKALTPRGTQFGWLFGGLALCIVEYFVCQQLGLDPMRVVPAVALFIILDRILVSGAIFESIYRFFLPQYKEKVIKHEAGHFLLAYLLGCPIQGYFISAWDAVKSGM
jgi:hypothetical protein